MTTAKQAPTGLLGGQESNTISCTLVAYTRYVYSCKSRVYQVPSVAIVDVQQLVVVTGTYGMGQLATLYRGAK